MSTDTATQEVELNNNIINPAAQGLELTQHTVYNGEPLIHFMVLYLHGEVSESGETLDGELRVGPFVNISNQRTATDGGVLECEFIDSLVQCVHSMLDADVRKWRQSPASDEPLEDASGRILLVIGTDGVITCDGRRFQNYDILTHKGTIPQLQNGAMASTVMTAPPIKAKISIELEANLLPIGTRGGAVNSMIFDLARKQLDDLDDNRGEVKPFVKLFPQPGDSRCRVIMRVDGRSQFSRYPIGDTDDAYKRLEEQVRMSQVGIQLVSTEDELQDPDLYLCMLPEDRSDTPDLILGPFTSITPDITNKKMTCLGRPGQTVSYEFEISDDGVLSYTVEDTTYTAMEVLSDTLTVAANVTLPTYDQVEGEEGTDETIEVSPESAIDDYDEDE